MAEVGPSTAEMARQAGVATIADTAAKPAPVVEAIAPSVGGAVVPGSPEKDGPQVSPQPDDTAQPDATDHATTDPVTPIKDKEDVDKDTASKVAKELRAEREEEIRKKYTEPGKDKANETNMTDDEFNLHAAGLLKRGEAAGRTISKLTVRTTDGQEVAISNIVSYDEVKGTYTCQAPNPEDPSNPLEIQVQTTEVASAWSKDKADSIARNFSDPEQKALVEWEAKGAEEDLPQTAKEAVRKENSSMRQADKALMRHATELQTAIDQAKTKGEDASQQEELLKQLKFVLEEAKGAETAAYFKQQMLKKLEVNGATDLGEIIKALEPEAQKADQVITESLRQAGVSDENIKLLREQGLDALLSNQDLQAAMKNAAGLDVKFFGRSLSDDEINKLAEKHLTPEQRELVKKIGKGLLIALLVALAVPVGAAVVTGVVSMKGMEGMK